MPVLLPSVLCDCLLSTGVADVCILPLSISFPIPVCSGWPLMLLHIFHLQYILSFHCIIYICFSIWIHSSLHLCHLCQCYKVWNLFIIMMLADHLEHDRSAVLEQSTTFCAVTIIISILVQFCVWS